MTDLFLINIDFTKLLHHVKITLGMWYWRMELEKRGYDERPPKIILIYFSPVWHILKRILLVMWEQIYFNNGKRNVQILA